MDRTAALQQIKPRIEEYLQGKGIDTRRNFKCFNAENHQHGDGKPSMSLDRVNHQAHCFTISCGARYDIIDLIKMDNPGLDDRAAFDMAYRLYNIDAGGPRTAAADFEPVRDEQPKQGQRPKYGEKIKRCAAALEGSEGETYFKGRGLTLETMRDAELGFNPAEYNKPLGKALPSIVIPYPGEDYFITRPVSEKAYDKPKTSEAGSEPIYNLPALYSGVKAVFVVESQICAISIKQAGGSAIALGGGGINRLIQQLKGKPTSAALILCLDNDKPGRDAVIKAGETLGELTFIVNGASAIMGECIDESSAGYRKDPNEVLQKDGAEALKAAIDETIQETISARTAAETERKERTGAGMVDNFLQAVQTRRYEPMPTGITDIDRAIGGGFIRQQLVLLGAAPGAGKTALAQWIFEGMAKRGTSCIFLNLEMAQEQILARSISRIAAQQGATIKAIEILQGYNWTSLQRAQITGAAAAYREEIAPRMIYNPQGVTANLDSILAYIGQEAQRAEAAGDQAPVCVLDYLQLVNGTDREDAATVIKRAVAGLKAYAIKHNTLVFVIIAHNRESNKTGAVTMEAGRDTSALEYSADLQLALTYTLCMKRGNQKGKAPDELTEDEKRKLTLKITKGRFGGGGKSIDLLFNGETMTYTQTVKDFEAVQDYDGVRL